MKSFNRSLALGFSTCLLVLTGVCAWGSPLNGLATPMPIIQTPQMPQQAQPAQGQDTSKSTTFTGTVVKQGDQYAVKDASGGMYKLDDATRAQAFEGKTVTVTGRLDADAKLIHVDNIEAAGSGN